MSYEHVSSWQQVKNYGLLRALRDTVYIIEIHEIKLFQHWWYGEKTNSRDALHLEFFMVQNK
jgi:hypothetical protein